MWLTSVNVLCDCNVAQLSVLRGCIFTGSKEPQTCQSGLLIHTYCTFTQLTPSQGQDPLKKELLFGLVFISLWETQRNQKTQPYCQKLNLVYCYYLYCITQKCTDCIAQNRFFSCQYWHQFVWGWQKAAIDDYNYIASWWLNTSVRSFSSGPGPGPGPGLTGQVTQSYYLFISCSLEN